MSLDVYSPGGRIEHFSGLFLTYEINRTTGALVLYNTQGVTFRRVYAKGEWADVVRTA